MGQVISKDGTTIDYDRQGNGPPVILVGGGLVDRSENAPLAAELAERFSVFNYDRRGRGLSGDTQPYALDRELEDIEALVGQPPAARLGQITRPALVLTGGPHPPAAPAWMVALDPAADAIAASIPQAERQRVEGQGHVADPQAVAAVLERFF